MSLHEINLIKRPGIEVESKIARSLANCAISFIENTEVVVGLEIPSALPIIAHGYEVVGTEMEEVIEFGDSEAAGRLAEFYQRMYGSDTDVFKRMYGEKAGYYQDCHAMVRAILGTPFTEDGISGYPKDTMYSATNISSLKPLAAYVGFKRFFDSSDDDYRLAVHGMVTTNNTARVLNVLGTAGSMVVANADVITDRYFGQESSHRPLIDPHVVHEVIIPATGQQP